MDYARANRIRRQYGVGWISEAWDLFALNPVGWIFGLMLGWFVTFVVQFIIELPISNPLDTWNASLHHTAQPTMQPWQWVLYPFVMFGSFFISAFVTSGYLRMALAAMRRQEVRVEDAFSGWPSTMRVLGYTLMQTFVLLLALVLPGRGDRIRHPQTPLDARCGYDHIDSRDRDTRRAHFSTFLTLGVVAVVDGAGVIEAFGRVLTVMKPHYGSALGAVALLDILILIAPCSLGVAYVVLFPMFWIVQALIGRDALASPVRSTCRTRGCRPAAMRRPGPGRRLRPREEISCEQTALLKGHGRRSNHGSRHRPGRHCVRRCKSTFRPD